MKTNFSLIAAFLIIISIISCKKYELKNSVDSETYASTPTLPESVENYTNRSPYPVLHLLRVRDVARGIQEYGGDTAPIWQKNKETMKALGLAAIKAINKQILEDAAQGSAADAEGQTD